MLDRIKLLLAMIFLVILFGLACVILFVVALVTTPLQQVVMKWRQLRAKIGIPPSQRKMLNQLWKADLLQRRLNSAYAHGDWSVQACASHALQQADGIAASCLQAGIEKWRVDAYRVDSHEYWWCIISSDYWADA